MKKTICLNCETRFSGNYCPRCGQKGTVRRLGWSTLGDDLFYSFTSMDRGFLFTIRELFTRPGRMMHDYLAGHRIGYYRPFAMLMVLAGVYLLLNLFFFPEVPDSGTDVRPEAAVSVNLPDDSFDSGILSGIKSLISPLVKHPATGSLLLLFVAAWVAPWVFRKNGGRQYNYVEYLFISVYMASQRFVADIVLLPCKWIPESSHWPGYELWVALAYVALAYVGLTAWNYKQLFELRWWRAIRKTIGLMILAFLIACVLTIIVLALLIGVVYVASLLKA
jgi:hypothetical protein